MRFVSLVCGATALIAPAAIALAQGSGAGQVGIFGQRDYGGAAFTVAEPRADLGRGVPMRSIRVGGGAWEVCDRANFTGNCTRFSVSDTDVRGTVRQVRSIRPAPPSREPG